MFGECCPRVEWWRLRWSHTTMWWNTRAVAVRGVRSSRHGSVHLEAIGGASGDDSVSEPLRDIAAVVPIRPGTAHTASGRSRAGLLDAAQPSW